MAATKAGVSDVPDLTEAVEAAARAYWEQVTGTYVVLWPCGCWITTEQAEPILASRAWAVWDRKRRARRKR